MRSKSKNRVLRDSGRALILLLLVLVPMAKAEEPLLTFQATDKSFELQTVEDYRATFNPHAILSLANLGEMVLVVTKHTAENGLQTIYDNFPKSLPADYQCLGRVMITIDGQQAAAFVVDGMFPPQGEPTHQTLLAITLRNGEEYDFMVHYPLEDTDAGLEQANALLGAVKWKPQSTDD